MNTCYLCECPLEEIINETSANHFEHIIPQAIGGQLTARDLLCKECGGDKNLGGNIDKPFSDMFRLITERIDMKRDRQTRSVPLKGKLRILKSNDVLDVHLKDKVLSSYRPEYKIDHINKKVLIFANEVVAKDFRKKVESDLRQSNEIEQDYLFEVISNFTEHPEFLGVLELPFNVDNKIFESGFAKIAIEFALSQGVPRSALRHLLDPVARKIKSDGTLLPYYPIFKPEEMIEFLRTSIDECFMSHSLVLFSQRQIQEDGEEVKQLYCFVELFGTFQYFVRLNNEYVGDNIEPITYAQKIIKDPGTQINMFELSPKDVSIYMRELGVSFADIADNTDEEARKMIQRLYDSRNRYVFDYSDNTKSIVDRMLMDSIINSNEFITGIIPDIVYHFYRNPDEDDFQITFYRSRYLADNFPNSIIPEIIELYESDRDKFTKYTHFKFRELEAFINSNSK
jgi:hypothetical protein